MTIDRDSVLVLTEEVKTCKSCGCDCHCKDNLHTPNDELDSGGPCVCEDCECKPSRGIDEEAFNGA